MATPDSELLLQTESAQERQRVFERLWPLDKHRALAAVVVHTWPDEHTARSQGVPSLLRASVGLETAARLLCEMLLLDDDALLPHLPASNAPADWRSCACLLLSFLGDRSPTTLATLAAVLESPTPDDNWAAGCAAEALARLGARSYTPRIAAQMRAVLGGQRRANYPERLLHHLLYALQLMKSPEALYAVVEVFGEFEGWGQNVEQAAEEVLLTFARSGWESINRHRDVFRIWQGDPNTLMHLAGRAMEAARPDGTTLCGVLTSVGRDLERMVEMLKAQAERCQDPNSTLAWAALLVDNHIQDPWVLSTLQACLEDNRLDEP